ncbi:hypothetical protein RYX36_023730, partial [Vicia faba]
MDMFSVTVKKSPVAYFLEKVGNGNSLWNTTTLGDEKGRERVYDTIFRLPWRCELLIDVGFFVCFNSFLSLLTVMPTRVVMIVWKLLKTRYQLHISYNPWSSNNQTMLSCRVEVQSELLQQVLLFMLQNKHLGMVQVCEFLKPLLDFSIIRLLGSESPSSSFGLQLVSSMASFCCSCPSPNAVEFIINHAEVSIAFVQENKIASILSCLGRCSSNLKTIVSFGNVSAAQKKEAEEFGASCFSWEEFLQLDTVTPVNLIGYGLAFLGVAYYNHSKLQALKASETQKKALQNDEEAGRSEIGVCVLYMLIQCFVLMI